MLIIRKEQIGVFETQFGKRFRTTLCGHVRAEFAAKTKDMTDSDLEKLISEGIERSRSYQVTSERDITLFVDLMFLQGFQFEQDRGLLWARKILLDQSLDGETKMKSIYARLAALENRTALPETSP